MTGTSLPSAAPASPAEAIAAAAQALRNAYSTGACCRPVRTLLADGDVAGAYAVQEENTRIWLTKGRRLVGRKIGLTAKSVQTQLGIDEPDFGMLFADMEILDGASVFMARLFQPRVEGELAFVMKSDITVPDPTVVDVIRAIECVLPAIEIVDSRIAGWDIGLVDTIADNASTGCFVLGAEPHRLADLDLRLCGMALEKNGELAAGGAGIACLGHPLAAMRWLAGALVRAGRPLKAGDLVLSGALGPQVPVAAGDTVLVRISGAGSASVSFEP